MRGTCVQTALTCELPNYTQGEFEDAEAYIRVMLCRIRSGCSKGYSYDYMQDQVYV